MKNNIFLIFILLSITNICWADADIDKKSQELKQVSQQIKGTQNNILEAKHQKLNQQQLLKSTEVAISELSQKLGHTNSTLKSQQMTLNQLRHHHQELQTRLQEQQLLLVKQLRAAYMLGQHQYIKLILNQQNPETINTLLTYYKYINAARLNIINDLNITLGKLNNNQQQIQLQAQKLQQLFVTQHHYQNKLQNTLDQRKDVLVNLDNNIQTNSQRLIQLTNNKRALESLITKLQSLRSEVPQPKVPFTKMQGKLIWPTHGSITKGFNYPVDDSGLTFNAVFITAPVGEAVKAIYPGKVIFADWLRGIGLLIILDHGNGFMTLYGHNSNLTAKIGDFVKAGQVIASVGKSSEYANSGLYFQIRANGKPLDPKRWCS